LLACWSIIATLYGNNGKLACGGSGMRCLAYQTDGARVACGM
jgi:hypothetical protein